MSEYHSKSAQDLGVDNANNNNMDGEVIDGVPISPASAARSTKFYYIDNAGADLLDDDDNKDLDGKRSSIVAVKKDLSFLNKDLESTLRHLSFDASEFFLSIPSAPAASSSTQSPPPPPPQVDFNASEFVDKYRSRVHSLQVLQNDLDRFLNLIQHEVVRIVNEDYDKFIHFSTQLVGIEKRLAEVRSYLPIFLNSVQTFYKLLCDTLDQTDSEWKKLNHARQKRKFTLAMMKVFMNVQILENDLDDILFQIPKKTTGGSDGGATTREDSAADSRLDSKTQVSKLLKIAEQLKRLTVILQHTGEFKLETNHTQQIQYLSNACESRLQSFSAQFNAGIEKLFSELVTSPELTQASQYSGGEEGHDELKELLSACLDAFALSGRQGVAEDIFRNRRIKPVINKFFSAERVNAVRMGGGKELQRLYSDILVILHAESSALLGIVEQSSYSDKFDIWCNSIWSELETAIVNKLNFIFAGALALPDVFYENYMVTQGFLARIEEMFIGRNKPSRLSAFKNNAYTKDFEKKWNLDVYFRLRFQEIATKFEYGLNYKLRNDTSPKPDFTFVAVDSLWKCLLTCFASSSATDDHKKGIYIYQCSHHFFKLALQLISRFHKWLQNSIGSEDWNKMSIDEWILLFNDLDHVITKIETEYTALVLRAMKLDDNDEIAKQIRGVIKKCCDNNLAADLHNIHNILVTHMQQQCVEVITNNLRVLTVTFIKTNKQAPSRPSFFVPNILKPLKQFLIGPAKMIREQRKREWAIEVIDSVTKKYTEESSERLSNAQKTEESLKRLVKRGPSATNVNSDGKALSDTDKIIIQMYLDAHEHEKQIQSQFGIERPHDEIPSLRELMELVKEGETLIAQTAS